MAGTGTYSAYRQLKPLEGDISQDIQQQEENGFKRRALDQAEEREKNDKAEKEQKRKDDLLADIKAQNPTITGSKSLDEVNMKGILAATNQWKSVIPVLEHPEKYSEQEVIDARIKKQNLNSFADKLANGNKILMDQNLAYQKAKSSGEIWENPIYENNFQTGFSNKVVGVTKEGNPALLFIDVNNDGLDDNTGKSGKIGDYIDYNDLLSGTNIKYDFQPRFDRDKELLEASTKLQPEINQTDDGRQKVKTTAINPTLLKEYVNNQLYEADGVTPTPKLKSFAKEAGITDFTDAKALKSISDAFENDIKLRVKGGTEVTKNFNALDIQKEQRQAAKDARAERKENQKTAIEKSTTSFDSSLRKDDFTGKVLAKDAIRDKMISISGENLKFKNLGGMKSGLNDGYITGFALDNKNNIVVTGKALISKGQKYKKNSDEMSLDSSEDPTLDSYSTGSNYGNFRRVVKSTELNDLATRAGYSNAEDLREELKKLNSGSKSSNKIKIDY